jgi:hypothetical protein
MWPLIEASILTSVIYTVGMFTKKKLTPYRKIKSYGKTWINMTS